MKLFGVYRQTFPMHLSHPELVSIWSDKDVALEKAGAEEYPYERVWVGYLIIDSDELYGGEEMVK